MCIEHRLIVMAICIVLTAFTAGCLKKEAPAEPPSVVTDGKGSATGTKEPKCTLAWKMHGHTTQAEAKSFAATCLTAADGAVDIRMSRSTVRAKLKSFIPSSHALTAIVPSDIDVFCPGYGNASGEDRAAFWRELLTAMARPESNYNTKTVLWEQGQFQYSVGLLQLSYNDKDSYRDVSSPGCQFTTEAEVTNPDVNLQCGVKIIAKLVKNGGPIGGSSTKPNSGAAAYWSTLRMSSPDARNEIAAATRTIAACQAK